MADMMDQTPVAPTESTSQNLDPRLIRMFQKPEGIVGVQGTFTHFVQPLRPPTAADTDYIIELPNTGADYVDLKNIELYVSGCLKRADGKDLTAGEKVLMANNVLHSLFESVNILIGHNQQEIQMNNYPYKAYLRQLMTLKNRSPSIRCHGYTSEFHQLDLGFYKSGLARAGWTADSKTAEFLGPTFIDAFQTEGYLLPATPLRVTLKRSRDSFYVTTAVENKDVEYKFFIDKIGLYVPVVKIAPFLTPLMEMQTDEAPASYHFEAIDVRQFALPAGTLTRKYTRVFQGKLPTRIVVAFYTQDSFIGDRNQGSLLTAQIDLRRIQLSINGVVTREHVLDINKGVYMNTYRRFTDWLSATHTAFPITFDKFPRGLSFFTFDLMDNCPASSSSSPPVCAEESLLTGFADISLDFGRVVVEEMIMMVYAISPDVIDISKERAARYSRVIM